MLASQGEVHKQYGATIHTILKVFNNFNGILMSKFYTIFFLLHKPGQPGSLHVPCVLIGDPGNECDDTITPSTGSTGSTGLLLSHPSPTQLTGRMIDAR